MWRLGDTGREPRNRGRELVRWLRPGKSQQVPSSSASQGFPVQIGLEGFQSSSRTWRATGFQRQSHMQETPRLTTGEILERTSLISGALES